ncbi:MAG: aminopeptidase P family protein [Sedimentisphaerales bacterium]|nr:aminopeptidase P family protein [Sedimentisphaerales bacterium]
MNSETIRRRIRAIGRQLKSHGLDCLILTKRANVTYTTGFMGDDSWAVIIGGKVYLVTDSRYTEQAEKECIDCKIVERGDSLAAAVAKIAGKKKSLRNFAVEKSSSVAVYEQLKKALKVRLKAVSSIVEDIRADKDTGEAAKIKTAISISTRALALTKPYIRAGVTESELAGMLDFQMKKLGAKNGFETIVAFGPNASRPHHQPGKRKLKKRDSVLIDFGAEYEGYRSDLTRCFCIGGATAFYKKVYDVVERAQAAAIGIMKDGADMIEVDAAARKVIAESGLPVYGHGSGHGFGLEIHENPFLKPDGKGTLKAGQILTIEPGIYIPGKIGVRIEDDVLVTKTGSWVLTAKCPHRPYEIG